MNNTSDDINKTAAQQSASGGVKTADNSGAESYVCPNCGGLLKWNIKKREIACASCGAEFESDKDNSKIKEHSLDEYDEAENFGGLDERMVVKCECCGANVEFSESQTAAACPMCGSPQVSAARQERGIKPDGIVPFAVDSYDASGMFKSWVKKRWFAPNKFKYAYQEGKLSGVYIPCWTFDADAEADYIGKGGIIVHERDSKGNNRTRTRWHVVSGRVSRRFDDMLIVASGDRTAKLIDEAGPYGTQSDSIPYSPALLSGFMAEHYEITAADAHNRARELMYAELKQLSREQILLRYDEATVDRVNPVYANEGFKLIMIPVWTSAFTFNNKNYMYVINGETGRVAGERPYSPVKIALAVLAAVAAAVIMFMALSAGQDKQSASDESGEFSGNLGYQCEYDSGYEVSDNLQIEL